MQFKQMAKYVKAGFWHLKTRLLFFVGDKGLKLTWDGVKN
jgi:hypothetical protein